MLFIEKVVNFTSQTNSHPVKSTHSICDVFRT